MLDVVVYASSLKDQRPSRKIDVLRAFADGAQSEGARVRFETDYVWRPSRLAVILGWASPQQKGANIKFRAEVIAQQQRLKLHTMGIDAGCYKFHDPDSKYLRYSINGVFYDRSEYANKNSSSERWDTISQNLNLTMQPWKPNNYGGHILILMQRDGGWSMKGLDPSIWLEEKLKVLKQISRIPIIIRPHPGKIADYSKYCDHQVSLSDSARIPLMTDVSNARAAVVFNSSSGVAPILHGIPLFVDDASSVCYQVANHDMLDLHEPRYPERTQWALDLAAAHWSDEESRAGLVYRKFLPYLV